MIARGVCWSAATNPTTTNNKTTDGSGTGVYSSFISGLNPSVTYYVRAYATNSAGSAYGNEIRFTTAMAPVLPTVITRVVSFINSTTAQSGGNITAGGSAAVIARGVCWSTSANPNIADSKTTDGSGTGAFSSSLSGLTAGATYYVRAYATNSARTAYGNEVSFTTTTTPGSRDIYVGGSEFNGIKLVAKIWKNGVATSLTNGLSDAEANSVYVLGTDVYVAGYDGNVAKVWKNGGPTSLTNGSTIAAAHSVYVSGTDVYVAGYEYTGTKSVAKIWKNGVSTSLSNGLNYAEATSVYVSGTDVYVAGHDGNVAKIWKNGVAISLTNGSNYAEAKSVYIMGTDVYVAGYEGSVAIVWKNGVATSLTNGSNNAGAYSVYVSGNDVYVAGAENGPSHGIAKVWINGIETSLPGDHAFSVYVDGTDVYVAGYEDFFSTVGTVWKNGVATPVGSNGAVAYSVFVK